MKFVLLTPVRLLGDGLTACLAQHPDVTLIAVVQDMRSVERVLSTQRVDVALIDVTQGVNLDEVRAVAVRWPELSLVALGLEEQRAEVIRCGRAGFAGYVARDASIDALCEAMANVTAGRLACSPEVSGGLLRALFRADSASRQSSLDEALTRREGDVLQLIGDGLSNKEIARDLCVSVATVKHHVHNILEKLHVPRRAQAMRRVREAPWIASSPRK
jgi:two-component system, NarL family, nitrate/nitrite response regulator NarL